MFFETSSSWGLIMNLPVIEDCEEKIEEIMRQHRRCWQFETQRKNDGRRVLRGLFCETNPEYSDKSWKELAILIA